MDHNNMNPQDINQMAQMKQIEEMKRKIMSSLLSKEAFERLGRVRSVNPQLASQAELYLLQAHQGGQLKGKVDETMMKRILKALSGSESKDYKIKRK